MRTTLLLLVLSVLATGQEVTLKIDRALTAEELVRTIHTATNRPILYAPADISGKRIKGEYEMKVPVDSVPDVFAFLLSTCDLDVRRMDPFTVVVPSDARVNEFRVTGLDLTLRFHRGPGAWHSSADMAGSLADETTAALLREAAKGDRIATELVGRAAPRTEKTARALLALLRDGDPRAHAPAALSLAGFGFAARPLLPELEQLASFPELK